MIERYNESVIRSDLSEKMVFVTGPRQIGKTTLAKSLIPGPGYLSWDIPEQRELILRREIPAVDAVVLDEMHKYRSWRQYLKGLYDKHGDRLQILVTGSARLDAYRHGGDSLQGRYHMHRLHPLSVAELGDPSALEPLLNLGGFPEPSLAGTARSARRWSLEYRTRLMHEEITSLAPSRHLPKVARRAVRDEACLS